MFLTRHQRYPKLSACVAVGLLINWLVLTLGIPLPTWQAKDRSRPFPCMDSVCGCHTAEKCWQSCCCHTNQEKLVWAKRNGVTPPNYVVAAASREAKSKVKGEVRSICCSTASPGSACEVENTPVPKADETIAEPKETGTVVLSSFRRCQGSDTPSINSELVSIITHADTLVVLPPAGQWIELYNLCPLSHELTPTSPPPQLG